MPYGNNILSIDYDSITHELSVYFLGGGKYKYHSVGYSVYSDFLEAKNKQEFFNNRIKDVFKYDKIY